MCVISVLVTAVERYETRVILPNSTTCFDIPVTDVCTSSLSFVWPQNSTGIGCGCPVYNSTDGQTVFEKCACLKSSDVVPSFFVNGSICLTDRNSVLNKMVVTFQCTTNPCIGDCFIKTIISLHRIRITSSGVRSS